MVAATPLGVVEAALRLGTDRAWRGHVSSRIAQAAGRLQEDERAVHEWARFLELAAAEADVCHTV